MRLLLKWLDRVVKGMVLGVAVDSRTKIITSFQVWFGLRDRLCSAPEPSCQARK
jgi:hypothetical protein